MRLLPQQAGSPSIKVTALIALHAILLAWAAAASSATFDEPAHLAAGAAYWRQGDFSIYCLSPPLLRLWASAPAMLAGAVAPDSYPRWNYPLSGRHWVYTDDFLAANYSRFAHLLLISRCAMIPISCLAAWMIWRWAAALYGAAAGVAACALWCLNPVVLAHGSLITTDLGTAAAMLAAAWLWWRFCQLPGYGRFALAALAVVIAHLCKFTAILLWPMLLAMLVPFVVQNRSRWSIFAAAYIALGLATLLALNALYGFRGTFSPIGSFQFDSHFMQSLQAHLPGRFPTLLPSRLVVGFDAQKRDTQAAYQGFLFGSLYYHSHWYYYPAALLCKLPVSVLLLGLAASVSLFPKPSRPGAGESSLIAALIVLALGVDLFSDINIGVRYLLPAFPLAFILISRLWVSEKRRRIFTALLAMLFIEMALVCPRFLSFVNFAAGGPSNGWRLLSDSDFDWGQSLVDLHRWMTDHDVDRVTLGYFGTVDPGCYGINNSPITEPGQEKYVAVSTFYLDGLLSRVLVAPGRREYFRMDFADVLRSMPPAAVVGNTIFIYTREDVDLAVARSQAMHSFGP